MNTSEATTSSDESSSNEKSFSCNIAGCNKKFRKNRKLQHHLSLHEGKRPFICGVDNCSKAYTNSSHLLRHKKIKHSSYSEQVLCPASGCGRQLTNRFSLKRHVFRCHNPDRVYPFMCNECRQGFYRKKQLQQHSYLHTGELPFSCDQCSAKFLTIAERNKHRRNHKQYICECGNVSERWTKHLAHKKICKLRCFKCSICEKEFSNGSNLKMHVNTHLNKEDRQILICPYSNCDRYYFYKTNLTVHINSFHKKVAKPKIPCTYEGCSKLLGRMSTYKNHLKTHEETKKPTFPRKSRKDKGIRKETKNETISKIVDSCS